MDAHQEIELKWALSPEAYDGLGAHLRQAHGEPKRLEQRNCFYDRADRGLFAAGLNLRLRHENGRLLLTCKRRISQQDGLHHHEEWERWLDADPGDPPDPAALGLPDAWLAALGNAPLALVGAFVNTRDEFRVGDDLLCLDRTTFAGQQINHELEIETMTAATSASRWAATLAEWGIPWTPQPLSKFARLLRSSGIPGR